MTRHLLVRADADGQIGLGHVLRTMAVADELARTGTQITYLCRTLSPWAASQLQKRGHAVQRLDAALGDQAKDAEATLAVIAQCGADAVLLDHYGLTQIWTAKVKAQSDLLLVAFDDLAVDKRTVDLLMDASPGRDASDYATLIPEGAICLAGPRYAPLRPEFAAAPARRAHDGPIRIAISMGGVDPTGVTLTCLDALDGRTDVELTVILSSDAKMLAATQARIAEMTTPTRLLLDRTDMAVVLRDVDLVLGAGGTSALERCALGIPSVLAVLANNQSFNASQLGKAGAAVVLPALSATAVLNTIEPLLSDPHKREAMGRNAAELCDGLGAPRVAAAILEAHSGVTLRRAEKRDKDIIHSWQNAPGARQFSRNPNAPSVAEHQAWFERRLARADQDPFYIIEVDGTPSGFVRLDTTDQPHVGEVSILVAQGQQGKGLARTALGLLRLAHPKRDIEAEVHLANTASQKLFEAAGYRRLDGHRFLSQGWSSMLEGQRDEH